ncbi:MAG: sensor histidine kinase [Candidatus Omnitrophica bacterium]|nr:sensor histidine kinase [Candidatus Omnitrophota bacterium]
MGKVRLSINVKITLLFLMLSVLLIGTIGFINYTYSKADLEERILSDLAAISNSKATAIGILLEEDYEDLLDVTGRSMIKGALQAIEEGSGETAKLRSRILESVSTAKEASKTIEDITIIGMDGVVIASTDPAASGTDLSESIFFISGKQGFHLSAPYMRRGVFVYEMSAPITGPGKGSRDIVGVAKMIINETRLYDILRDYSGLGSTGETILGQRKGGDIVFLGPMRHRQNMRIRLRIPLKSMFAHPMKLAIGGKTGFATGRDYRGQEVFAAYYHIPLSDWGLVVKIDKQEAFQSIYNLRLQLILFSGLLFLLSALAIMQLARYITDPIEVLHQGTRIIADGNLGYRVKVSTSDEIGELASSFNDMAAHLQKITVSVDRLNEEIKERKIAEERLNEAVKVKTNFISTVSHEIRTPLAAVKEGINIVLDGILGPVNDEQKDFLARTRANVDRLTRLINEILDFQKLESGRMVLYKEENDIVRVAKEVYHVMAPLARQKGVAFKIIPEDHLPKAVFDRDRIAQVLTNLIDNAVKFTDKGEISVKISKGRDDLLITVSDTGRGISQEDMPRLFKSFEQLGKVRDSRGGTGLGLVISRDIVELHDGRMWAESEPGRGSEFHFTLPISTGNVN